MLIISFALCAENEKILKTDKNNKMKSEKMISVDLNKYEINLQMQTEALMIKEKKVRVS